MYAIRSYYATLCLSTWFIQWPLLHLASLSLWLALCIFLSLLEQSLYSYAFLLSGYTAVFITLPYVVITSYSIHYTKLYDYLAAAFAVGALCAMARLASIISSGMRLRASNLSTQK